MTLTVDTFQPPCPVCRRVWMTAIDSGPAGARWRCSECKAVVVMPRAPLTKAVATSLRKGWRR